MDFIKTTEQTSAYKHLEKMSVTELLYTINKEDKTVAYAVEKALPQIEKVVFEVEKKLQQGGRLFYIGAGTSGRLGVVDASECPPTFGVSDNVVIGIIAGGDKAIRKAVEFAEDSTQEAWKDLQELAVSTNDVVLGIAASGTTPYVVSGIKKCNANGITTACITCNQSSPLAKVAQFPVEVVVGAEFVTGSSRMKAGTAQKMVLNMISTATMIRLGRVKDNKMVDMQLSNTKLVERGIKMIVEETGVSESEAQVLLNNHKSVRKAVENYNKQQ